MLILVLKSVSEHYVTSFQHFYIYYELLQDCGNIHDMHLQ